MLLLIAGLGVFRAQSLTWAAADASDGTRYKLSPTVLSHILQPGRIESATVDCAVGPSLRPALPTCRLDATAARFARQISVASLLLLGSSVSAFGTALLLLRQRHPRYRRVGFVVIPAGLVLLAAAIFQSAAIQLLAAIGTQNGGFGGIGWYLARLAPLLAGLAAALEWQERPFMPSAVVTAAVAGFAGLLALVLVVAPRPLGNSVALLAALAGLTVGLLGFPADLLHFIRRSFDRPAIWSSGPGCWRFGGDGWRRAPAGRIVELRRGCDAVRWPDKAILGGPG